jgi:hypothetical protein
MTAVYVLSLYNVYGDPEGHPIVGVYSDKNKAEKIKKFYPSSQINEVELDKSADYPIGYSYWIVRWVEKNGALFEATAEKDTDNYHGPHSSLINEHRFADIANGRLYSNIWATDGEHIKSILLEYVSSPQYIADKIRAIECKLSQQPNSVPSPNFEEQLQELKLKLNNFNPVSI